MKCDYTIIPSWFGGEAQARNAVNELGQHAAQQMRERGNYFSRYEVLSIRSVGPDLQIATIEYHR